MAQVQEGRPVHLYGVGDVGPIHEPLGRYSELVRDTLKSADIRFAQCERTYSERGYMQVHSGGHNSRQPPKMIDIFPESGFNVVSLASNHGMDWGSEALLDTKQRFEELGIQTIGAGANREDACRPAIFTVKGVRIGLLGYCSVPRDGYCATDEMPGVAPMRIHTYYKAQEYQPGTPPRILTIPDEKDVEGMRDDIAKTQREVDHVVCSFHWGIHHIPKMLAEYQHTLAQTAFACGASLVLGHHQHVPKGIEVIDGKVCFHGLGNFMFTTSSKAENKPGHPMNDTVAKRYGIELDPDYPTMPYGADGVKSMIASAHFGIGLLPEVSFLPVLIDKDLRAEILRPPDPRFSEAVDHMDYLSSELNHHFTVDGDEVQVT